MWSVSIPLHLSLSLTSQQEPRTTKRLVGQPTKLQDYHIKSITEAKGQAFVATSLDEAQRRIDQLLIRISNGEA